MREVQMIPAKREIPRKKRVGAYTRVTSGKEAALHSLSAQISYYSRYIQQHGDWLYCGVYADAGLTGTKQDRPEFQRLMRDCRNGKIDMVITKAISRLNRNTLSLLETVRELKTLGVDVYFERENIHSMSGDGELMLSILASVAQEESRQTSENQKWRIRRQFEIGIPNGGLMLGYRLFQGTLYILPDEARIVKMIFRDYLDGMGGQAICNKLNARGHRTVRDNPWGLSSIMKVLRNDKYTGDMVLQKYYVEDHLTKKRVPNKGELPTYNVEQSHEAIISRDTFEQVQREIELRVRHFNIPKEPPKEYLFSGKIRCGICGCGYRRKTTNAGTKYEKPCWICSTFNTRGKAACASQQIPEAILLEKARELLGTEDVETAFREQITEIRVPGHNRVVFVHKDGANIEVPWENPSRRESWSAEARSQAAENTRRHYERTKGTAV